jgi:hypothetical protein
MPQEEGRKEVMPKILPSQKYAAMDAASRKVLDLAVDLLMEYTKLRGPREGLELLKHFTVEQHRQAIIEEYDDGEIRLVLQGELLVWFCYLPESDDYQPIGAALRVKDCPTRN